MTQYLIGCGACTDFILVRESAEEARCPGCFAKVVPDPDWSSPTNEKVLGGNGHVSEPESHGTVRRLVKMEVVS